MKPALAFLATLSLFGGSYYCSTQIGLRTEGFLDVEVETTKAPKYDSVGQSLYSYDGTKLLVTSITRGSGKPIGQRHVIRASVKGVHRYALQLFPTRMVHSFSMDRKGIERTLLEAAGMPQGEFVASTRQWHVVH